MLNDFSKKSPLKSIKVEVGTACHAGMVRASNEDSLLSLNLSLAEGAGNIFHGIFGIADGVGGNEDGEVASNLALRILAESIVQSFLLPGLKGKSHSLNKEFALQTLTDGMKAANNEVFAQGQARGNDMGTTLTSALVTNGIAYIANVGDSRLYLLEGEQLRQVTKDHSLVAELVRAGEITTEEVYTHPRRNIITRCLGTQQSIEIDLFTEVISPGKSLLLCSDGLWEMVRDNEIKNTLLEAKNAQTACDHLIELANKNGGVDNISTIVAKISS